MNRILIIDDDRTFAELMEDYLSGEGFDVSLSFDGEDGLKKAQTGDFDLAVVDVMLPKVNGIELLTALRKQSDLPVLMLTARGDDIDRILGLELGADDYLPKPCNSREVVARIRAVLRRTQPAVPRGPLTISGMTLNPLTREVQIDDLIITLTSTEFSLLQILFQQAGYVVSKAELSELGLGRKLGRYDRSIDMHLSHIRKKIGSLPSGQDRITTIRGVGYQLVVT